MLLEVEVPKVLHTLQNAEKKFRVVRLAARKAAEAKLGAEAEFLWKVAKALSYELMMREYRPGVSESGG